MDIKIINMLFAVLLTLTAATSCSDSEETLEPTGISSAYHLPQGSHDYDQRIVDFYNQTGTYILYDFTQKEACWTPTGWKLGQVSDDDSGSRGYTPQKADQQYVGRALDLLNSLCLDYYSEKFKKTLLPVKILLCSQLDSVYESYEYIFTPTFQMKLKYVGSPVPAWYNYHNLCLNYVNSGITTMTAEQKQYLKFYLNNVLMKSIMIENFVTPTQDFAALTDYTAVSSIYQPDQLFAAGTFPSVTGLTIEGDPTATAKRDWYIFMYMMIAFPESFLTDSNVTADSYYSTASAMMHGILSPVKDTNGLLRQRYDMVRNYFKTNYDTDLQAVGNGGAQSAD